MHTKPAEKDHFKEEMHLDELATKRDLRELELRLEAKQATTEFGVMATGGLNGYDFKVIKEETTSKI